MSQVGHVISCDHYIMCYIYLDKERGILLALLFPCSPSRCHCPNVRYIWGEDGEDCQPQPWHHHKWCVQHCTRAPRPLVDFCFTDLIGRCGQLCFVFEEHPFCKNAMMPFSTQCATLIYWYFMPELPSYCAVFHFREPPAWGHHLDFKPEEGRHCLQVKQRCIVFLFVHACSGCRNTSSLLCTKLLSCDFHHVMWLLSQCHCKVIPLLHVISTNKHQSHDFYCYSTNCHVIPSDSHMISKQC